MCLGPRAVYAVYLKSVRVIRLFGFSRAVQTPEEAGEALSRGEGIRVNRLCDVKGTDTVCRTHVRSTRGRTGKYNEIFDVNEIRIKIQLLRIVIIQTVRALGTTDAVQSHSMAVHARRKKT